jgi:hypothetical protein
MAKAYEYVVEIRAGFNKLSNDMRQTTNQFKRLERDVTGIFKNIGTIAKSAAVLGGVVAVNQLKNAIIDLAKKGEAAGSVAEGFQKLGGSAKAIDQASQATLGLVGKFELMKRANQAFLKGIPEVNKNFATFAEYAGRVANTLDQDTSTALDNLINGLATVKEKQLAAIGITINADEAYRKYAEANNIAAVAGKRWEDILTSQQQKVAKQAEAINAVRANMEKLAPVTDSVANAEQAYQTAIDDGLTTMGIAINNNEDLMQAYRELEQAVKAIDWESVGKQVAAVSAIFASMASTTLPWLVENLKLAAIGFETLFGDSVQAQANRLALTISGLQADLARIQNTQKTSGKILNFIGVGGLAEDYTQGKLDEALAKFKALKAEIEAQSAREQEASAKQIAEAEKLRLEKEKLLEEDRLREEKNREIAARIKEAAAEAQKFNDALNKEEFSMFADSVKKGLDEAIKSLDKSKFDDYVAVLKEVTKEGVIAGFGEGYKNAPQDQKNRADVLASMRAEEAAQEAGEEFEEQLKDANEKAAKDAEEKYRETAEEVKSAFTEAFRAATQGDWRDSLLDFIGSLAGALAAAFQTGVTKNPDVISGLADLGAVVGNAIAQQFGATSSGGGTAGGGSGATGAAIGAVASAAGQSYFDSTGNKVTPPEGAIGQNQDGTFIMKDGSNQAGTQMTAQTDYAGYAAAAGTIAGSFTKKNKPNTNSAAGAQAGAVVGTVIGAYFGAPALGAALGSGIGEMIGTIFKTGLNHPESKARVKFEQWLEEQFKDLGKIRFFGPDGTLQGYFDGNIKGKQLTKDFSPTINADGTKSPPVWVDNMKKWGDTAFNTFVGLGEAMKELLGITDEVGAQLGYILGTNLSGKIDNARLLVQQLGLSFEDVSKALLDSALKGQITWLAFNSYIRDTAEAFKPGLEAVGAIGDAFKNLLDSAGQGREAIKSFKDIAVEAMEAGIKTMDQLRQFLLSKGYDPEYVDALINSALQRGVDTLEEMANASDATAGSIVGDMEAMSGKLRESWEGMRQDLQKLTEELENIPKEVQSKVKIKIETEYDENTREAMAKLGDAMPNGIPSEGSRDLEKTATASTGRSSAARLSARSGRSLTISTGNPFGGGVIRAPSITGKPYDVAAGGMNLTQQPGVSKSPAVSINIDAKGAGPGVEQKVLEAARYIEARVISQIVPMMKGQSTRGGRGADY